MPKSDSPDAVVVGSGPNGLAAATVLAAAGLSVRVLEAAPEPGGGCRTAELTRPGFLHDVCSAVHPLALASSFFQEFDLEARGVRLLHPLPLAHPLDDGSAAVLQRSVRETGEGFGPDAGRYRRLLGPLVEAAPHIVDTVLSSMRAPPPRSALSSVGFLRRGLGAVDNLVDRFETAAPRAMLSGIGAHSMRELGRAGTSGVALLLTLLGHAVGWPIVEGGSVALTDAMVDAVRAAGGEVICDHDVRDLAELPPSAVVLLDVAPRRFVEMAGSRLPSLYRRQLTRFRYGPGVCKVDWALSEPVPWTASECRLAGTVHIGGTAEEIARAESEVAAGQHSERPFVLCAQPGTVDDSRAPAGAATLWTYCHVPSGSERDMSEEIARQLERFAPGFRDLVLEKSVVTAAAEETLNANYVGGDIAGGAQTLFQTVFRPALRWNPYRTPVAGVYLCSASTPPGPGVHGRCGQLAALSALRDHFGLKKPPSLGQLPAKSGARTQSPDCPRTFSGDTSRHSAR